MWCAPPAQSSQWDRRVGDEARGEGRAEPAPTGLEGQLRQLDSNFKALGLRQISRQGNSVGRYMFPEEPSYGQQSLGRSEGCQAGARQSEGGHGVSGEPGERRWSRRMGTQAKGPHSSWWPRTSCGAGWMVVGTQEQSGMGVRGAGESTCFSPSIQSPLTQVFIQCQMQPGFKSQLSHLTPALLSSAVRQEELPSQQLTSSLGVSGRQGGREGL